MDPNVPSSRRFPVGAGLLFGLGLDGFIDGIMLHQLLQWHHVVSHRRPRPTSAHVPVLALATATAARSSGQVS